MLRTFLVSTFRNTVAQRGSAAINILGLTIGLVVSALIILYVNHELGYDEFHEYSERIYRVAVKGEISGQQIDVAVTSPPFGPALANDFPEIEQYVRISFRSQKNLLAYDEAKFYVDEIMFADSAFFKVFSVPLTAGNPETALEAPRSVVLSASTAGLLFGEEDPIGKVINYNNQDNLEVTGVFADYPGHSHLSFNCLVSYATIPAWQGREYLDMWGSLGMYTYILVREGTPAEDLGSKMSGFLNKYMGEDMQESNIVFEPYLQALTDIHLHSRLMAEMQPNGNIADVYTLIAVIVLILLLASINFMNLATAKSANRAREVGIRKVVGSERRLLIYQFLGESVLMSLAALVLTIFLIELILPMFNNLTGKQLDLGYVLSWKLAAGFLLMSLLLGIIAGSYPAFYLSSFNPVRVLQGTLKPGSSNKVLRNFLVFIQFTVSAVLLSGTLIIYQQLEYVHSKELGFASENVLLIPLRNDEVRVKGHLIKEAFNGIPGVQSASLTNGHPGGELNGTGYFPEGYGDSEPWLIFGFDADPDFIDKTMNMEILRGRNFSHEYPTDSTSVLINETLLRKLGWDDPVGKTIAGDQLDGKNYTVIGVLKDFHNQSLHEAVNPAMIKFLTGVPGYLLVNISAGNVARIIESMKDSWDGINPEIPFDYQFLDASFERFYDFESNLGRLMRWFTAIAFFIAVLGLSGLSAFSAERRTKEIGIRKAVGASTRSIALLLSWDFMKPILPAIIISAPVSYWLIKKFYLQNFAYQVSIDASVYFVTGLTAIIIALVTVNIQTTRAAGSNPVHALRYE